MWFRMTAPVEETPPCAVVTHFVRLTTTGHRIEGAVYIPHGSGAGPGPLFPMFVLSHGFSRDYGRHISNAVSYACAGILTYTPNAIPVDDIRLDEASQVDNLVDHVLWLRRRVSDPEDLLYGIGDAQRLALGGHSAGAAVSVEAMGKLQEQGVDIDALVLLDPVPDQDTLEAAAQLQALPVLSVRSRPGACNAYGSGTALEEAFPFAVTSVFFPWATHCDPESPTDVVCRLLCGGSSEQGRAAYRMETLRFLKTALSLPPTPEGRDGDTSRRGFDLDKPPAP